jgi:hypothetical protein
MTTHESCPSGAESPDRTESICCELPANHGGVFHKNGQLIWFSRCQAFKGKYELTEPDRRSGYSYTRDMDGWC